MMRGEQGDVPPDGEGLRAVQELGPSENGVVQGGKAALVASMLGRAVLPSLAYPPHP
jgi:hypothetical protein